MPNAAFTYVRLHKVPILLTLLSIGFYYTFAYALVRTDFIKLCALYFALFFLCSKLIQFEKWNFKFLLLIGILFRLVFLLATPTLSQDFYRFIWDGELIVLGVNPYVYLPSELVTKSEFLIPHAQELVDGMGSLSANHYSNYPPFNQALFALSVWLGGTSIMGSLIAMRLFLLAADVGIFYFGRKLLKKMNRSPHLIFWYFLNPLVIIEISGNVHYEGVMLFFLLWALYLLIMQRWILAAIPLALSVSVKLVPLMFLPLFFKHLGIVKGAFFNALILVIAWFTFIPFYDPQFADHYLATLSLWFSNFEFNAGIYNGIKQLGLLFEAKPWELIKVYGKITALMIICWVFLLTVVRRNQQPKVLLNSLLFVLTSYFFLASTVHPWYLISLVLLCLFTDYRFPLVWAATVVLSYSAYANPDFNESLGLLAIEYLAVFGFLSYEIFKRGVFKSLIPKN